MHATQRITITLNPKQPGDAQILAALDVLGGEAPSVLKLLTLVGINANPSLAGTLASAVIISTAAKKVKGKGYSEKKQTVQKVSIEKGIEELKPSAPVEPVVIPAPAGPAPVFEVSAPVVVPIAHVLSPGKQREVQIMEEAGRIAASAAATSFNTGNPADDYSKF